MKNAWAPKNTLPKQFASILHGRCLRTKNFNFLHLCIIFNFSLLKSISFNLNLLESLIPNESFGPRTYNPLNCFLFPTNEFICVKNWLNFQFLGKMFTDQKMVFIWLNKIYIIILCFIYSLFSHTKDNNLILRITTM